jgi:tyrosyl-tRNA synthetase
MFPFLPEQECRSLCEAGKNPNDAKERLAWEVTSLIHGRDEADKALSGAKAAFGGGGDKSAMPRAELARSRFAAGYNVVDLFCDTGLVPSKSEGRRLVQQGGAFVSAGVNREDGFRAINDPSTLITEDSLNSAGELVLRAGKKKYLLVIAKQD